MIQIIFSMNQWKDDPDGISTKFFRIESERYNWQGTVVSHRLVVQFSVDLLDLFRTTWWNVKWNPIKRKRAKERTPCSVDRSSQIDGIFCPYLSEFELSSHSAFVLQIGRNSERWRWCWWIYQWSTRFAVELVSLLFIHFLFFILQRENSDPIRCNGSSLVDWVSCLLWLIASQTPRAALTFFIFLRFSIESGWFDVPPNIINEQFGPIPLLLFA